MSTTPNHSNLRVHPASLDAEQLLQSVQTRRSRSSGPGGQHRNKVETAVELIHTPTGVIAHASERRSQRDNKRVAIKRLRLNLAIEVRCPFTPTVESDALPSELWQARKQGSKMVCSDAHTDFPTLLAEALDITTALGCDPKRAAVVLGISMSQLIKFLKKEPRAIQLVNQRRQQMGLHTLK